jgi:hypothetical protein
MRLSMRVVFPVMLILLGVILVGFLITNPTEHVTVTFGDREFREVSLTAVVLVALTFGVAFTAAVALIEGATIRLANRRLRREVQRLETENSFLRSQNATATSTALAPDPPPLRESTAHARRDEPRHAASAPVYEADPFDATRGD